MGDFANAAQVKTVTTVPALQNMLPESMEELYIYPAERAIEEEFDLDLNTNGNPRHMQAAFDASSTGLEDKYRADYRRAVILTVQHMATNPQAFRSESVRGASAVYSQSRVHPDCGALMGRWRRQHRCGRGG